MVPFSVYCRAVSETCRRIPTLDLSSAVLLNTGVVIAGDILLFVNNTATSSLDVKR